jgi:hypothetical protein
MWLKTNNPKDIMEVRDRPIQFKDTVYINMQPTLKFTENGIIDLVPTKK